MSAKGRVIARAAGLTLITAACGPAADTAQLYVLDGTRAGPPAGPVPQGEGMLLAFPEAEGWGAEALKRCDRSRAEVLRVTSLQNAGSGSLRAAVEGSEDGVLSIVVFDVAGYLELGSEIELRDRSCLYIAGQSAPGDGITIRRAPGNAFITKGDTHDLVLRHLRFRGGWAGDYRGHAPIIIGSGHDILLDHLSLSWTTDKALVITKYDNTWSLPIGRISVQRTILSEVFADHPTGAQISGEDDDGATEWMNVQDISLHRNLFAHNSHRNPNVTTHGTELINNVVYNWKQGAVQSTRGSRLDVVANYFLPGPMTDQRYLWEVTWNCENHQGFEPSLHVVGNLGPHNGNPAADNWTGSTRMVACYYRTGPEIGAPVPERFRRSSPLPAPAVPVTVLSATDAFYEVLGDVGANAGLACEGGWLRRGDAVDRRVLADVRNRTGSGDSPSTEADVGGFPSLDPGTPCPDSDGDGMPDAFEARFGFDPTIASDALEDADADGYLNVEEFLNASDPIG